MGGTEYQLNSGLAAFGGCGVCGAASEVPPVPPCSEVGAVCCAAGLAGDDDDDSEAISVLPGNCKKTSISIEHASIFLLL